MLFSIMIPVYNTSKYLEECLESVLVQSEKDYEVILLDDGSTDKSPEICDEYEKKHPNIRVIHKANEGLLLTRRRGFYEAKGDYLVCLDSDDCLADKNALKKLRELIEKENCDLVLYDYIYGGQLGQKNCRITLFDFPSGYIFPHEKKNILYEKLLIGKGFNAIWIKCISRSILDLNTNYEEISKKLIKSQGEDLLQTFPVLTAANKIGYLKEPFYFYRWNEESISRNPRLEYYYAYKAIYQKADEYINFWNIEDNIVEQHKMIRISMIMTVVINGLKEKDLKESVKFINILSKDHFFSKMFEVKNKKNVLLYYRLVGNLIIHNLPRGTLWLIRIVSNISNLKRKKRK